MLENRPKKSLGQHFLTDLNIARKITESLNADQSDKIIEVGPGRGVLTSILYDRFGDRLNLVEYDNELADFLIQQYPAIKSQIFNQDILKVKPELFLPSSSVIGNFPYNISSQIFFKILDNKESIPEVVCMIQKEVAERISAKHGNKTYGILSVLLQAYYDIDYLFTVHEHVFNPPPKVKSAVIRLRRKADCKLHCDEKLFFQVVKVSFNQRRKTLRNSLSSLNIKDLCTDPVFTRRPEQLSVSEFIDLTNLITMLSRK